MKEVVAVCPRCRRRPKHNGRGHLICAEHGRLANVDLIPPGETTEVIKREDDVAHPVVGECKALVSSRNSPRRGILCGRPARWYDAQGEPVCGIHSPGNRRGPSGRNHRTGGGR